MTHPIHHRFAKNYLKKLLSRLGQIQTSGELGSKVRQVDIYFVPTHNPTAIDPQFLGLLAQIALNPCIVQLLSHSPNRVEICNCFVKLFSIHAEQRRQAKRKKSSPTQKLPRLWIISPSISTQIIQGFGTKVDTSEEWLEGIYFLPDYFYTGLVVINQLPIHPNTIFLRVLGRGTTQQQAVNELVALPKDNPLRHYLLQILAAWWIEIQFSQNLDERETQELTMNLSPAYLCWREDTLLQGELRAIQEDRRSIVEKFVRVRFGEVDDRFSQIIESMLHLPPQELTIMLLNLVHSKMLE